MKKLALTFGTILSLIVFIIPQSLWANSENHRRKRIHKKHKVVRVKEYFIQLDVNNNHRLSRKEVRGDLKTHFNKIDINGDGYISKRELRRAPKSFRQRR